MSRFYALAFCGLSALGCAAPARSSAPPTPREAEPGLPADLDVAIRVDIARLASELGGSLAEQLVVDLLVSDGDSVAAALVKDAVARSELLWLGFRAGLDLHAADKVLIFRGRFGDFEARLRDSAFSWSESGTEWPHFERLGPAPGSFERVYPLRDRVLVLATRGETPVLEPSFEQPTPSASLRPPDRGTVSAAARAEELRRTQLRAYPTLAEQFSGAEEVTGYAEPRSTNLDLALDIAFAQAEQARSGGDALEALSSRVAQNPCVLGSVARTARVSVFERSLRVSAEMPEPLVNALKACVLGGNCCA